MFDQDMFYRQFLADLEHAHNTVVIESPYITTKRMRSFWATIARLRSSGVQIVVNTKPIHEHDKLLQIQSATAIARLQDMGVMVLFTVGHHRKLAIIDRKLIWEGSLNILSQNDSCEYMRRTRSCIKAGELMKFLSIEKFIR